MLPLVGTLVAALSGLLVDKGVGMVVDVCEGLTDAGVEKTKELIKEKTGIDIADSKSVANMTEADAKAVNAALKDSYLDLLRIQRDYRQQDLQNTMDTRAQHLQMANAGIRAQITVQNILAITQIIFAMSVCTAMIFCDIPKDNQGYANTILGFILGSVWGVILNFYFGSALKDKAATAMEETINLISQSNSGGRRKSDPASIVKNFGPSQQ